MQENISKAAMWNMAGIAGLALGAVSSAYLLITGCLSGMNSAFLKTLITFILWIAKFAGCIILMRFFMKKFVERNEGAGNRDSFIFGIITALCSALIYSAVSFVNAMWINPQDLMDMVQSFQEGYAAAGGSLDSNSIAVLEKMSGYMPQISFFSTLVYCFLFGTVLSAILSKNIPHRDPFADFQPKNEE